MEIEWGWEKGEVQRKWKEEITMMTTRKRELILFMVRDFLY